MPAADWKETMKDSFRLILKRDGSLVPFEEGKIARAISRAFRAAGEENGEKARELAREVVQVALRTIAPRTPTVEQIQDIVERVLIDRGYGQVAKAYILYRHKRAELRNAKKALGVMDELKLSLNAVRVLERRYLRKDTDGHVCETPLGMFRRVARTIAAVEANYGGQKDVEKWEEIFFERMKSLEFLPNSPTLMNAGTRIGQLSACFVIPVGDSMRAIFRALTHMALVHQTGGGTGFSFSNLRPRGDIVGSTRGVASGPVSFMHIFDTATAVVKQGGRRRGANMGILSVNHPDIMEFIQAKSREGFLTNFNISVAVTDDFMEAVRKGTKYPLINPRTKSEVSRISARAIFDLIASTSWKTGDPGVIFIDEINRHNPTPELGRIEATNPCGEQPLLPYESCNLGSINLSLMVRDGKVDWQRLREVVRTAVRFLDNVIDANRYIVPEIKRMTLGNRKIGLGVMGFADMLVLLGIPYDSTEAVRMAERVMKLVTTEARKASAALARERGVFPNWSKSVYRKRRLRVRNATVTTIAPTGTISIIAGCSSGIEPIFALSFVRNVLGGAKLLEIHQIFEREMRKRGLYDSALMMEIARTGRIRGMKGIPRDLARIFPTAFDISPEWHVKMQAAFQKYCDNSVSKTVNLPAEAAVEDVRKIYRLAYRLKCKGITIYRYGTRKEQVLRIGTDIGEPVSADSEYSGGCPSPECIF